MFFYSSYPKAMQKLVNELTKLPSIGEKSALRLAYHLLIKDREESLQLARAIEEACEKVCLCETCYSLSDEPLCTHCRDQNRARNLICVVEKPVDVIALERSGKFRGLYHVLHGLWSPMKGIRPEQTKIGALFERVQKGLQENSEKFPQIEEVVIATSTTVEGDATALYVAQTLRELGVSVTRIAQGMPKGGELEYADEITLTHAMDGRRAIG